MLMCAYGILVPQLPWAAIGAVWLYVARLDGRARCRQAALRAHPGRAATQRGAVPAPADRGGPGDVNFTKKLMVEPGAKVRLAKFDPGLSRQARRRAGGREGAGGGQAQARRSAAQDVRRQPPLAADRAAGAGRRRQGRRLLARGQRHGPARLPACRASRRRRRRKRRTISSGASTRTRRPRARSRCSTARTTRTCWSPASTSWCRRRSGNARYELINDWERLLARGERHHHPQVLPRGVQGGAARALRRSGSTIPKRQWKISDADYKERAFFDDYLAAFDDALERTSTPHAPWFTIPCDNKWFRNLAVAADRAGCHGRDEAEISQAHRRSGADPARIPCSGRVGAKGRRQGMKAAPGSPRMASAT